MSVVERELALLRERGAELLDELGVTWWDPERTPDVVQAGIDGDDEATARAWRSIAEELAFFAEQRELGYWYAAWPYAAADAEQHAVVRIDTEGELTVTRTMGDALLLLADDRGTPSIVASHYREWQEEVAASPGEAHTRARLLPSASERFARIRDGAAPEEVRQRDPDTFEELLGMLGSDPRVEAFLVNHEMMERPLDVRCDGEGRVVSVAIENERVLVDPRIRGVSFGERRANVRAKLGEPVKASSASPEWDRYTLGRLGLHIGYRDGTVCRLTISIAKSSS